MKEIHILHLMPKLLSLYGEYGNVAILTKVLTDHGYDVTVNSWESGSLTLEHYDLVYIGSGTEDNLAEAIRRLAPYTEGIRASIDGDQPWLATGNAMAIFGSSGLDVLPYDTTTDAASRHMGDVLTEDYNGAPMVGYINTSCQYEGIAEPLFRLRFGHQLGNDKGASAGEGIRCHQFYGTQLIGPVLVKNPHFLEALATRIAGEPIAVGQDTYLRKAYDVALQELQKRSGT